MEDSEIIIEEYEIRDHDTPGKKMQDHLAQNNHFNRHAVGVSRIPKMPSPKAPLPKVGIDTTKSERVHE